MSEPARDAVMGRARAGGCRSRALEQRGGHRPDRRLVAEHHEQVIAQAAPAVAVEPGVVRPEQGAPHDGPPHVFVLLAELLAEYPLRRLHSFGRERPLPRVATSTATAIGRSYIGPALRTSAGARFTVTRCSGNLKPVLRMPARTRSRASCTAVSGSPTTLNAGSPLLVFTSTSTGMPSMPENAAEMTRAKLMRASHATAACAVGT